MILPYQPEIECPKCPRKEMTSRYCRGCGDHGGEGLHWSCECDFELITACKDNPYNLPVEEID